MKKGIALFTLGNMIAAGIGYADNGAMASRNDSVNHVRTAAVKENPVVIQATDKTITNSPTDNANNAVVANHTHQATAESKAPSIKTISAIPMS